MGCKGSTLLGKPLSMKKSLIENDFSTQCSSIEPQLPNKETLDRKACELIENNIVTKACDQPQVMFKIKFYLLPEKYSIFRVLRVITKILMRIFQKTHYLVEHLKYQMIVKF
jgi:hypothetical protein